MSEELSIRAELEASAKALDDASANQTTPGDSPPSSTPDSSGETQEKPENSALSEGEGAEVEASTQQEDGEYKRPQSWRKEIGEEAWKSLPKDVKAEITRREKEINDGLQIAAQARKFAQQFEETVRPYEAYIRESNISPMQAVQNLLDTVHQLRTAPNSKKAQLVAQIVNGYGVDVRELDSALASMLGQQGNTATPPIQDVERIIDERIRPIQQNIERKFMNDVKSEVDAFVNDPANEFLTDQVRQDMGDLLALAAHRGETLTLKQAYEKVCRLNPEVQAELARRQAIKEGEKARQAVQTSRSAAVSPSTSSPQQKPPKDPSEMSLREQLLAAMSSS